MKTKFVLSVVLIAFLALGAEAQQTIGFVDSEQILSRLPEYATVQQNIERMANEWDAELKSKQREVDEMFQAYQARELLYTADEKKRRRDEIVEKEEDIERLRMKYFGPEGDLFTQQDNLMRPLQERVLSAIEEVATSEGYSFVFDRSGDFLFLYADEQHNLNDRVLRELGIDVAGAGAGRQSN
jgi:outer membrane protein